MLLLPYLYIKLPPLLFFAALCILTNLVCNSIGASSDLCVLFFFSQFLLCTIRRKVRFFFFFFATLSARVRKHERIYNLKKPVLRGGSPPLRSIARDGCLPREKKVKLMYSIYICSDKVDQVTEFDLLLMFFFLCLLSRKRESVRIIYIYIYRYT